VPELRLHGVPQNEVAADRSGHGCLARARSRS
jgi:hypothetical protein